MPRPYVMDGEYLRRYLNINTLEDPGCWLWHGSIDKNGYGKAVRNAGHYRAHRFSYELLVGPIPRGLQLDHLCRNRSCVNPTHLEIVTNRENWLRGKTPSSMYAKQTHCKHGHLLSGDNVYNWSKRPGWRTCRMCNAIRAKQRYAKKKASLSAVSPAPARRSGI